MIKAALQPFFAVIAFAAIMGAIYLVQADKKPSDVVSAVTTAADELTTLEQKKILQIQKSLETTLSRVERDVSQAAGEIAVAGDEQKAEIEKRIVSLNRQRAAVLGHVAKIKKTPKEFLQSITPKNDATSELKREDAMRSYLGNQPPEKRAKILEQYSARVTVLEDRLKNTPENKRDERASVEKQVQQLKKQISIISELAGATPQEN